MAASTTSIGHADLPPGHRLIAAIGTDFAPQSWWETLGPVERVRRAASSWCSSTGPRASCPRRSRRSRCCSPTRTRPGYIWLWGNLLAALAIARAAPAGRFQRFARAYRTVSFVVLGIALLPFLWYRSRGAVSAAGRSDVRLSRILGNAARLPGSRRTTNMREACRDGRSRRRAAAAQAADASPPSDIGNSSTEADVQREPANAASRTLRSAGSTRCRSCSVMPPARCCRPGPAFPPGATTRIDYDWSGPVESADTVRFVYVGPVMLFFWRLIGVIALAVLFALARVAELRATLALPGAADGSADRPPRIRSAPAGGTARVSLHRRGATAAHRRARPGTRSTPASLLAELKTAPDRGAGMRAELRGDHRGAGRRRWRPARSHAAGERARADRRGHAARERPLAARRSQRRCARLARDRRARAMHRCGCR